MKLRNVAYIGGSLLAFLLVFIFDIIRKNVQLDVAGLNATRDLLIIGAFVLIYLYLNSTRIHNTLAPAKRLGLVMIYAVLILIISLAVYGIVDDNFDTKDDGLIPLTYGILFISTVISILYGLFAILVFRIVRGLVLFKRKKDTERNFLIFVGFTFGASLSTLPLQPLETSTFTAILVGFAILFGFINSFRLPWIVYMTKREKIFGLVYGLVLFLAFLGLNILINLDSSVLKKATLYYSYPLNKFILVTVLFGNIYFGMAFISTLFHLPTAEAFDRKITEVASLHNLGRLVTQVFDFKELVESVTSMTLQVCEAQSCWLEMVAKVEDGARRVPGEQETIIPHPTLGDHAVTIVGNKNIDLHAIEELLAAGVASLRADVLALRKPVVVDDVSRDARFAHSSAFTSGLKGSMVVVPLVSHSGMVGILYATKDIPHGFFKDDIDVISAFADQATIAIENSRLIEESIERERLLREMTLAQEIQRKLLPQTLPSYPVMEIDAVSTPAFEVGGDYYDMVELENKKVGIVVGDVSGKGVSAAFYMSEVKGIFQSLSRLYNSPRQFMIKANEALSGSIDKHSFVSLIYAVIDLNTGLLTLARAGHCPLLHLSGDHVTYVRPGGMGLGLSNGFAFESSMEECTIQLKPGDVCVFYTDGVTEARRGDDEFGYDRLLHIVAGARNLSASGVKEQILQTVQAHAEKPDYDDDLTVVVVKWRGNS